MKILILGFFFRNNLGDDAFVVVYKQLLSNHTLYFFNTDDYPDILKVIHDVDIILCGGGDIINNYFINSIKRIIDHVNIPIYAISIGIPFAPLIQEGYLDIFDYVIVRNQIDLAPIQQRLKFENCSYSPDIVFLLDEFKNKLVNNNNIISKYNINNNYFNIGVFLPRTILHPDCPKYYNRIIINISNILKALANNKNYKIYLIPFNFAKNNNENDKLLNIDIKNLCPQDNIININDNIDCESMFLLYDILDFNICGRLHSHIYSIATKTPFISIAFTRKVKNLMIENELDNYMYLPELDNTYYCPIKFDEKELLLKINYCISQKEIIYNKLVNIMIQKHELLSHFKTTFVDLINRNHLRSTPPFYLSNQEKKQMINKIGTLIIKGIYEKYNIVLDDKLYYYRELLFNINNIQQVIDIIKDDNNIMNNVDLNKFLSGIICIIITNITQPIFFYGLNEQILSYDYNFLDSLNYLINMTYKETNYKSKFIKLPEITKTWNYKKTLNINYISQIDFRGLHRSGWQFVVDHLCALASTNNNSVIIDAYLDRTFHWGNDVLHLIDKIPFKSKWIGFIHHTYDTQYSEFNNINLFKNKNFINSLKFCKGLFVLSDVLRKRIMFDLSKTGYNIKVNTLYHPSDFNCKVFDINKFLINTNKKIVQIGGWLRNSYAIYQLNLPNSLNKFLIKKAVLKGRAMENYFKPNNMFEKLSKSKFITNKYYSGMIEYLEKLDSSVEIISELSNDDYDILLEKNIVFINLYDASAVNTVIECIIRNTPILINKIPAVVEYLGENYPFYYDDISDAGLKAIDINQIIQTYNYLKEMDKTKFTINYFIKSFINSSIYKSL